MHKISVNNIDEKNATFKTENTKLEKDNEADVAKEKEAEINTENVSDETTPSIFTDKYLLKLEKTVSLTDEEKFVIQDLNSYNAKIIELLHASVSGYLAGTEFDFKEVNEYIQKEKDLIQNKLVGLLNNEKGEAKLLKVFEHITASESDDRLFSSLQERKAILITDYFLNKPLSISEQAMYICERGKTDKEHLLIDQKIANVKNKTKELAELVEVKSRIMYEKIMLDHYYRARSLPKDNYFKDNTSKLSLPPEIVEMVGNTLVQQAFTLLNKNQALTVGQQNELEALLSLLTKEHFEKLNIRIEKIADNKRRKNMQKILKDILKNIK